SFALVDSKDVQCKEDEGVQLVEVTGFKPTTSEEMLRLYFENPRKSKGDEIETWEMDTRTKTIRIKYSDPSVARAVTEKTHKLEGVQLTVSLFVKRKTRPRPVKKRCLVLRGIPDGCPSEHVELYIENCSGMDEPIVKYGEKPGTALCTFKQDIPDLQKVIQKICSKKLQKAQVTAEVVNESDCMLVQGLTDRVSLEFIELYFDNKKKSGGGGVREVLPGSAEDQAIVYFEDWKVIADVLSKKGNHKVGNAEVSVEEYHDCLGRLSELDVPTPHIPKPISMQVPQQIMEFIFGAKGKHTKKKLVVVLKNVKALLRWPDGDKKTAARLEPLEEDGKPQFSWLNWSQLCDEVFTGFLKGCRATEIQVPSPLWKEASANLAKINATQICSVVPDDQTHSVQLVGEQQDVDTAAADIMVLIKELQAKADSDAQLTKEEIAMTPNKLTLFTQCGIRRKMEQMFPNLKITIAPFQGQMGLVLEGTRKKVVEAELWMRRQMDGLNSVEFKTGRGKTAFIRDVSDKIHEILGSKDINAACNISADGKIKIYGSSKNDTSQAKMYIDLEIEEDVIRINGPAVIAVLKSQDGTQLVAGINTNKFAKADINYQSENIELAGFRNELKEIKQHILTFLKDTVKVQGTIRTNRSKVRMINTYNGQELTSFTAKHQRDHVIIQPQMSGRNVGFHVEGNEEGLEAARQFVSQLLVRIKEKPYPVTKIGMVQLFRETKGKKFLESVEEELECVIDVIGENENDDEDVEGATASPPLTEATEVLCRVTIRDGCTLRVCKGDLTKQKVDCIVNATNVDLKQIRGLAAAILKAGGQIIQTECDEILKKKGRKLYEAEPICTSSGSLPCKKVIHVAGPRWPSWKTTTPMLDDQPTHEEHLLFESVFCCLRLANQLKMQSIAIPAISTDVNGFPRKLAAIQIVDAVVGFSQKVPDTSLTEIRLTNHDQQTCDVMKQVTMDQLGHLLENEPSLDATADWAKTVLPGAAAEDTSHDESQRETIRLHICAMDDVTIRRARDKIDRYQAEAFTSEDDQGEEDEGVHLVEVTGFKSTTSEEMLRLYFESPRKSKGGEIETWEMDTKTGTIGIKYSDPSVARAVTERTHKLEGVQLTLRLIVKRKPRPRPVKKRCLFLRGIPDRCPSQQIELYLENCSDMDEPRVEYGEKPGTALCTFTQDIQDLRKVIRKICSKKLQGSQVTAEVVHECDCILVQGLTDGVSLEFIELYFDNKKKSGGGGVREVLPGNAEDQAIVYFEDWKVIADVLSKKGPHKVGNAEVSVEEYNDCLGRLSELDVPTPHTPKPISMQVHQDIMEFIFGVKGKHTKKKLVEELKKVKALLRWPDGDKKTAARLEPLEGDGQPQSSWLNWSQLCNEVLTGFLNRCKSTAVYVPSPLWKEASVKLTKINATQICSVLDDQTHSVELVGEKQDVNAVAADILVVIKELQAKADSDAQQTKETIVMTTNRLKLFTQCGIRRKMEKMFPDLKITIPTIQGQMGLIVEGTRKKVVEAELWMRRQMDGLNSVELKTGTGKTAFIRDVSDKIHEILGSKDINAACSMSADGKIKIYGSSKKDTSLAKMYIEQEIEEDVIRINGPAVIAVLKSQDGIQLVTGINEKKVVKADINYQSGNIELVGFQNELKETKQHILAFLNDTVRVKGKELFTRMQVKETKKQHSEHLWKEVQWKYSTPTGEEDYQAEINVIIEDAYQSKQPSVVLHLVDGRVTIDFRKMEERSRAGAFSVNRVDLQHVPKFQVPSSWIPMKPGKHFQLMKLAAGTQEYTDVETRFRSSMGTTAPISQIDEILRIQNTDIMMQYQARKAALEARLGRTDIEETLYHGTDEQTCDKINKYGFNRSFSGKKATVYGNGTYFAAEASFSARSIFAKPNANNTKHIYAAKVLVGDFTTGAQSMVVPPNKPNNPDQLYDSVVDNVGTPSIYVIFHDAQAYPEHLIKYK
ncbi:protein mono-ADP-ribosyltransferase PARP14-like, partial [Patiria miniata]|uniref:Poly [ADP-ribose] polymerase n=1 Tax=Patiria miniata TaxID=46514 RepID=A0A913Z4V2_PATMI